MMDVVPSKYVRKWLQNLLIAGGSTGWGLAYSHEPDGTNILDNYITVFDTTPIIQGRLARTGEVIQHEGILVRIRALDYDAGYKKGKQIEDTLATLSRATITVDGIPVLIHSWTKTQGLVWIQQQENNNRQVFTTNGIIAISEP